MADIRKGGLLSFGGATSYTLTGIYVASNPINCKGAYQVGLDVAYTMGESETGNSIEIKVEFSNEETVDSNTNWYQQISTSTTTGTSTISLHEYTFTSGVSAGTFERFHISFPTDAMYYRVSLKETGIASTGGTATVRHAISEDAR